VCGGGVIEEENTNEIKKCYNEMNISEIKKERTEKTQ